MTTALDRLRDMVGAARRDTLISTAEADILDRLVRVAEDEDDERLDGALEELADNLRRALDRCVERDNDADDDLPTTGCPTCDAVIDALAECHGMSLRGTTAAEVAESARDWIGDLIVERDRLRAEVDDVRAMLDAETRRHEETSRELDAAHAEVERLRAEVASLREQAAIAPGGETSLTATDLLADSLALDPAAAPDADEPDAVIDILGPWWIATGSGLSLVGDGTSYAHVEIPRWMDGRSDPEPWRASVSPRPGEHQGESGWFASMADGVRWCERHPHLSSFFASWQGAQQPEGYTSAPTVGAPDAGPDAPALIVEGDAAEGAREACAVPAAPVSPAEQLDEETGVDRPHGDERIVGPREGEDAP